MLGVELPRARTSSPTSRARACWSSAPRPTTGRSASSIRRGKIVGFEPDLAADIAKRLGVKLELVPVVASNRIQFLQQGKIDLMIATMSDTPERRKIVDIVEPDYYASGTNVHGEEVGRPEELGPAARARRSA